MEFTGSSIALTLFTALIAGLGSYFGAYSKVKAEVRAATEDLRQTIENLAETTRAVEIEKARVATDSTLAADRRKAIYGLAVTTQSLIHSMCWLGWDVTVRKKVRADQAKQYDNEAHKFMPEMFGHLAMLYILDRERHAMAEEFAMKLSALDVAFGDAIVLSESDEPAAVACFRDLYNTAGRLQSGINELFGASPRFNSPQPNNSNVNGASETARLDI